MYTLFSQIKIHGAGSEDIFNYVPKKIMPLEIGGLGKTHNNYNGEFTDKIIQNIRIII